MQRNQKDQIIKSEKPVSLLFICKTCGGPLVYWYTKEEKLVYECEKCGWAIQGE